MAETLEDVVNATGIPKSIACARISKYRKMGIKLKKLKRISTLSTKRNTSEINNWIKNDCEGRIKIESKLLSKEEVNQMLIRLGEKNKIRK